MMNSLEGKRGNPRIKPPFPAVPGVFGMPTTINNVETLAAVPHILVRGAEWYKGLCLGNPEEHRHQADLGLRARAATGQLRDHHGHADEGPHLRHGRRDAARPHPQGGDPRRLVGADHDARKRSRTALMDYEGIVAKGSMLGSAGMIVMDDTHRHGVPDLAARPVLRPRVLRPVHPVPRRHRVDDEDSGADPGGEGQAGRPRAAARSLGEHDRQDDLRAERLLRGAGGERNPEVPRRSSRPISRGRANR